MNFVACLFVLQLIFSYLCHIGYKKQEYQCLFISFSFVVFIKLDDTCLSLLGKYIDCFFPADLSTRRMSVLPAKPGLRHSVSEWYSNNQQLSATAQHERQVSSVIRQEGRSLRNETSTKVSHT